MFLACMNPNCDAEKYEIQEVRFLAEVKRKIHQSQHNLYNNQYLYNLRQVHDDVMVDYAAIEGFIAAIRSTFYELDLDRFRIPFMTVLPYDNKEELFKWVIEEIDSADYAFIVGGWHENQLWNVFFEVALIGDSLLNSWENRLSAYGEKEAVPTKVMSRMKFLLENHIIRKNNIL